MRSVAASDRAKPNLWIELRGLSSLFAWSGSSYGKCIWQNRWRPDRLPSLRRLGKLRQRRRPAILAPSPSPLATPEAAPQGAEPVPTFAEKVETLRNSDVELRFTNRGGGIVEAFMLNHIADDAKRVILNSPKHMPIGAMVDDPAKPALPEFTLLRESDSTIRCERATPDGITIRKKFSLLQSSQKKDNFLLDLESWTFRTRVHSRTRTLTTLSRSVRRHRFIRRTIRTTRDWFGASTVKPETGT